MRQRGPLALQVRTYGWVVTGVSDTFPDHLGSYTQPPRFSPRLLHTASVPLYLTISVSLPNHSRFFTCPLPFLCPGGGFASSDGPAQAVRLERKRSELLLLCRCLFFRCLAPDRPSANEVQDT